MTKRPKVNTVSLQDVAEHCDTSNHAAIPYPSNETHTDIRTGLSVLLVWWGVWTLADKFLIATTPWSEIAAMAMGATLYNWDRFVEKVGYNRHAFGAYIERHLQRI